MSVVTRCIGYVIFFVGALSGCKNRSGESDTKEIGVFDSLNSAQKGGGRNSFYGTPKKICTYSKFVDDEGKYKEGPPGGDFTPSYVTFLETACKQRGGRLDGDGTICLKVQEPQEGNQGVQGTIKMVENLSQLASVLDIDIAGRLSMSGLAQVPISNFSLSPAARYFSKMNETDRSVYFLISIKYDGGSENMLEPAIRPEYLKPFAEAVESKDATQIADVLSDFLDDCGDEYTQTINYGGEFIGVIEASIKDGESKSQVYGEIQAEIGFGKPGVFGGTAGVNASTEHLRGMLSRVQSINIFFAQNGGNVDGVRLTGILNGMDGYQKLIESAENFITRFSDPTAIATPAPGSFDARIPQIDARPEGSRGKESPPTVPGAGSNTVPTEPGTDPGQPMQTSLSLFDTDPTRSAGVKGAIRNANYWVYGEIRDFRAIMRKGLLIQAKEDDPKNIFEYLRIRRERLAAYLAKFEKIKTNYKMLVAAEAGNVELTPNQHAYINKYKEIYKAWTDTMSMGSQNCVRLGSACKVPEETPALIELMKKEPMIVLSDFKLPVPVKGQSEETVAKRLIDVDDWRVCNRAKSFPYETENVNASNVLIMASYFEGMQLCGFGWRFPREEEFPRLEELGLATRARAQYPAERESLKDTSYNYRCFWRLNSNRSVTPKTVVFPAWTTEAGLNGSHIATTPEWKKCFVVCVNGSKVP